MKRAGIVSAGAEVLLLGALLAFSGCERARVAGETRSPLPGARAVTTPALVKSSRPTLSQLPAPELSLKAQLGKRLFFDERLSASGKMACSTCHDPARAYGPPNDLAVQLGGPERKDAGERAVPSLRYLEFTPAYADLLDNPDGMSAPGPGGGFTWDGRKSTLAEQAKLPLLSPLEMANTDGASVVEKVKAAGYEAQFTAAFGPAALSDAAAAFDDVVAALEAFQREDSSFHPYTSKYDLYTGNKLGGAFTAAELRGAQVFSDPARGNCSSCHFAGPANGGSFGMFSDYSYEAIGVPRNPEIPANRAAEHFDLGLCGPMRSDHAGQSAADTKFCGMFKTPSLRNVATRQVFFHNGVLHSLEQVLRFYNTRDVMPELWYPTVGGELKAKPDANFPSYGLIKTQYVGGHVEKYDDLPKARRGNIDTQKPLDGRKAHSNPPLTEKNLVDLRCFLDTLTDDYQPPSAPLTSGPCVD